MPKALLAEQSNFLDEWAELGGQTARQYGFPVSAMLALASVESKWGKGGIFLATLNPFNLQKWPHIRFPTTHRTYWHKTVVNTTTGKVLKAPFNCAISQADAVRQWCEWIIHYGAADGPPQHDDPHAKQVTHGGALSARESLLSARGSPLVFARRLSRVGFGESAASGEIFAQRLSDFSMTDYD